MHIASPLSYYIEVGRYIERIFPALGIRFIAINDNYDSLYNNSSSDQLLLPFKNLINDAYSRDISVKVTMIQLICPFLIPSSIS